MLQKNFLVNSLYELEPADLIYNLIVAFKWI